MSIQKIKSIDNKNKVKRSKSISFIELAEKIISTEKPEREKLIDIVTLEALRYTMKNTDELNFGIIMKRFPYFS